MFPGQGSQMVGMGKNLYQSNQFFKERINKVKNITGIDMPYIIADASKKELDDYVTAQLSLYSISTSIAHYLIENDIEPWVVMGHSLGEYSALVTAGALAWEEGLQLLLERGRLMEKSNELTPGAMASILGMNYDKVEMICKEVSMIFGEVKIANYNGPNQSVVSGNKYAVEEVVNRAREFRVIADTISVKGASHSPLMELAQAELKNILNSVTFRAPEIKMVSSITGDFVEDIDNYYNLLKNQITKPVVWEKAVKTSINAGCDLFIEIGPGRILTSLVKGIDRNANVISVCDDFTLESLKEEIKQVRRKVEDYGE